jgi:hypothetical protein
MQPNQNKNKNRNRFKLIGFRFDSVVFGQKPIQTDLARFFLVWLGFFSSFFYLGSVQFDSVFSVSGL